MLFLVDTGSAFSLLPHSSGKPATGPAIVAADGTPISCWGSRVRTVVAAGSRFKWNFLLAAVSFPIIGADFLENFDLAVDLKRRRLVRPGRPYVPLAAPPSGCKAVPVGVVAAEAEYPTTTAATLPSPSSSSSSPSDTSARGAGGGCEIGLREGEMVDPAGVGEDVN